MSELLFPVVGALTVFFVLVPLLTLLARSALSALPVGRDGLAGQASALRFLLIVGPSLAPVIWLVSAAIHQSESGAPLRACIVEHLDTHLCQDVALFGALLMAVLGLGIARRVRRGRNGRGQGIGGGRPSAHAAQRVQALCQRHVSLSRFAARIGVVSEALAPACTRHLMWPRVELDAALVDRLDDAELSATLLHELEHARARDPLRFFVAQVALSINPLGRLLAPELARYHFAREALCDRRAVQCGAEPLALARSIVSVASGHAPHAFIAALGGHGIGGVRVRVQLLLGYASQRPAGAEPRTSAGLVASLLAWLAVWPHVIGADALDLLHHHIERAALIFGLG